MAREDIQVNIRLPAELKQKLETQSGFSKRSLTAEIVSRLEESLLRDGDEMLSYEIVEARDRLSSLRRAHQLLANRQRATIESAATARGWTIEEEIADRLRLSERAALGDFAHLLPPTLAEKVGKLAAEHGRHMRDELVALLNDALSTQEELARLKSALDRALQAQSPNLAQVVARLERDLAELDYTLFLKRLGLQNLAFAVGVLLSTLPSDHHLFIDHRKMVEGWIDSAKEAIHDRVTVEYFDAVVSSLQKARQSYPTPGVSSFVSEEDLRRRLAVLRSTIEHDQGDMPLGLFRLEDKGSVSPPVQINSAAAERQPTPNSPARERHTKRPTKREVEAIAAEARNVLRGGVRDASVDAALERIVEVLSVRGWLSEPDKEQLSELLSSLKELPTRSALERNLSSEAERASDRSSTAAADNQRIDGSERKVGARRKLRPADTSGSANVSALIGRAEDLVRRGVRNREVEEQLSSTIKGASSLGLSREDRNTLLDLRRKIHSL